MDEIDKLLKRLPTCLWLYADVPIAEQAREWGNYRGTHIIDGGWSDLTALFEQHGFNLQTKHKDTIRFFAR